MTNAPKDNSLIVRQATKIDAEIVIELIVEYAAIYQPGFPFDLSNCQMWVKDAVSNDQIFIGILNEDDGILLAGMSTMLFSSARVGQEIIWYTRERCRGHGLRLFRAFENWALENGAEMLSCGLPEKNATFERAGFEPVNMNYFKLYPHQKH